MHDNPLYCARPGKVRGPEASEPQEGAEADEPASPERPAAESEQFAEFITPPIEQLEQSFSVTAQERVEAVHQVVKELQPTATPRRGRTTKYLTPNSLRGHV
jgi:hypothetical protein